MGDELKEKTPEIIYLIPQDLDRGEYVRCDDHNSTATDSWGVEANTVSVEWWYVSIIEEPWEFFPFEGEEYYEKDNKPKKLEYKPKPYFFRHKIINQPQSRMGFKRGNRK